MSININELRTLSLIIKYDTLSHVASILNMTQPGVSRTLKSLEKKVGKELFYRHKNKLIPTKYALHLSESATPVLEDFDALSDTFVQHEPSESQRLEIIAPNIYSMLFSMVLKRMYMDGIQPRVNFSVTPSPQVIEKITQQNYHLGVVAHTSPIMGNLRMKPMVKSPIRCLLHRDSPLAELSVITPEDLKNEKIMHTYHRRSDESKNIERIFRNIRADNVPFYVVDSYMVPEFVGLNMGIGLVSDIVSQICVHNNPDIRVIPFSAELYQSLYWITPSDTHQPALIQTIVEYTHDIISQYSPDSNMG